MQVTIYKCLLVCILLNSYSYKESLYGFSCFGMSDAMT